MTSRFSFFSILFISGFVLLQGCKSGESSQALEKKADSQGFFTVYPEELATSRRQTLPLVESAVAAYQASIDKEFLQDLKGAGTENRIEYYQPSSSGSDDQEKESLMQDPQLIKAERPESLTLVETPAPSPSYGSYDEVMRYMQNSPTDSDGGAIDMPEAKYSKVIRLGTLNFALDSSVLQSSDFILLTEFSEVQKKWGGNLLIVGYSSQRLDSSEADRYALQRATEVSMALQQLGVPYVNLDMRSLGYETGVTLDQWLDRVEVYHAIPN